MRAPAIEQLIIPDSVTDIGEYAFNNSTSPVLQNFIVPDGVESIGGFAFANITHLESISLPDSIRDIGHRAFSDTSLTSITIPRNATATMGAGAWFRGCTALTHVEIADGATAISRRAFMHAPAIEEFIIPDSVAAIGEFAFYGSTSPFLQNFIVPDGVESIGDQAFANITHLESISLPDSLRLIGYRTFANNTSLTSITIPRNATTTSGGGAWFIGCTALTHVVIADGAAAISRRSFMHSPAIEKLIIPDSVTSIDEFAFSRSTSPIFQNFTIPEGVESIGAYAFSDLTNLQTVTIPASVRSIGMRAFSNSTNLRRAIFHGNPPNPFIFNFNVNAFSNVSSDFAILFNPVMYGWTTPTWHGFPAMPIGEDTPEEPNNPEEPSNAIRLNVNTNNAVISGEIHTIDFELTNMSDTNLYNVGIYIASGTVVGSYILNNRSRNTPEVSFEGNSIFVSILSPGDTLIVPFSIVFEADFIEADLVYVLQDLFVITMDESDIQIPVNVNPQNTPPTITTMVLPSAIVGEAYDVPLEAIGSIPIQWSTLLASMAGDGLPSGLNLSDRGRITGIPTTPGTFEFEIIASNSIDVYRHTFELEVLPSSDEPGAFILEITAEAGGNITSGESGQFAEGQRISVSATPNEGYSFGDWIASAGTFDDASSADTVFTMPGSNVSITARFENNEELLGGVTVSGLISSFNPGFETRIQLLENNMVKYEKVISSTTGMGQIEQHFVFNDVEPGTYTLSVTKTSHTSFVLRDIVISGEDIDLTQSDREEIRLITLTPGDINGDGQIDSQDLSILMSYFGLVDENLVRAGADLNGDGQVDARDLSLLMNGFSQSDIEISW